MMPHAKHASPSQSGRTGTVQKTASHPGSDHPGVGSASHAAGRTPSLRPQPAWSHLELAALPTAPSCARLHTKQVLWEWGLTHLSDTSELVISELVTNAMQITHQQRLQTPIRLWLTSYRHDEHQYLLIEVWDGSTEPPKLNAAHANDIPPLEESGRGLFLVATLCERYGWYPDRSFEGKVVWGEVTT